MYNKIKRLYRCISPHPRIQCWEICWGPPSEGTKEIKAIEPCLAHSPHVANIESGGAGAERYYLPFDLLVHLLTEASRFKYVSRCIWECSAGFVRSIAKQLPTPLVGSPGRSGGSILKTKALQSNIECGVWGLGVYGAKT